MNCGQFLDFLLIPLDFSDEFLDSLCSIIRGEDSDFLLGNCTGARDIAFEGFVVLDLESQLQVRHSSTGILELDFKEINISFGLSDTTPF